MKCLFCGDVVGSAGREAILTHIPYLIKKYGLDFVVVNGENAAGGYGINPKIAVSFFEAGVDVITTGNHVWDQKDIINYINNEKRLLRPLNFAAEAPGQGYGFYKTKKGYRICVVNIMTQLFMEPIDRPFPHLTDVFKAYTLSKNVDAIIIDVHGEATSEKNGVGYFADGKASLVVGSHSHAPTNDARILPKGTAYLTDAGMCGDYNSIIGMQVEQALPRMVTKIRGDKLQPATGEATLCGILVEISDTTGLAKKLATIKLGGVLNTSLPEF